MDNQAQMIKHHLYLAHEKDDVRVLNGLKVYIEKTPLNEDAQIELIKALEFKNGRDSLLDGYEKLVILAGQLNEFTPQAERMLLLSNAHEVILSYIKTSKNLLKEDRLLFYRRNPQEMAAYVQRYSKG